MNAYRLQLSCILLFFCFLDRVSAQTTAYTLTGYVKDVETKEALAGVNIFVNPKLGTATDDKGFFSLKLNTGEAYTIVFSYIGYQFFEYHITGKGDTAQLKNVLILLRPEGKTLDQVVITASRSEEKLKTVTVSMEVVKPYLVENKNTVNINQVLDQIPSVSFTDGQANIRGGSGWSYGAGTRVMVMLDEMPMISGDAGQAQWSYLPTESIEQIEVIKGASSVLYGSSALNGVINVRTIRPKEKPYTAVSLYSGIYDNPSRSNLKWQDKTLQRSGFSAVHAVKVKNFETTTSINYLNDDGYRMSDGDKRLRLSVNTRYTPKKIKNMYYDLNGNVMSGEVGSFLLWESFNQGYTQLDTGFNRTKGFRYNLDPYLVFFTGQTRHSLRGRFFYLDNNVQNNDTTVNQSNTSNLAYLEYQVKRSFEKINLSITGGLMGMYNITNSPVFQGFHYNENFAPFVQVEKKWKKLTANAGARYESFRLDNYKESKPVFRAGINYEAAKATFIRASFGQGYRFPTVAESYVSTSSGPLKIYPNPNLKSETGWNAEVAVKQGVKLGKWLGYLDLAAYWMEFNRMMEFNFGKWGPNLGLQNLLGLGFSSVNVGRARVNGIDFSFGGEGKMGNVNLQLIGGYTYMNPVSLDPDRVYGRDNDGNPLTYHKSSSDSTSDMLKYRFNHMAKVDVQATYKRWMWGASFRYNSFIKNVDRFFTDPLFGGFVPGIPEARKMGEKGDYVIDLRTAYEINSTLKVNFIVNNVLNRLYMTRPADLRPPRMFIIQFNYKLNG